MTNDCAQELERTGEIQRASLAYEALLEKGGLGLDGLINLVVLYWQVTDFGFSTFHRFPSEFVATAGRRLQELLGDEMCEFSSAPEFVFWKKYIEWADVGGRLEVTECLRLMRLKPGYLEPVMFVFSASNGAELVSEAEALLARSIEAGTIRGNYVASVIRGVQKRSRWRPK